MAVPMLGSRMDAYSNSKQTSNSKIFLVYAVFATIALLVYHLVAEGEFSSVLTLSAIFQCMAFSLLLIQALGAGNVHGISAKSLQLDTFAIVMRLSSTTWLQGYLPNDITGDYIYQCIDALSLVMVLWLLYRVLSVQRSTYDEEDDIVPSWPFAAGCFVLALLLHGDLNDKPLFDATWLCSLFVAAIAVIPQLWMMTHSLVKVSPLTSHFVAVMAFSRVLSGTYMWHAHNEITCEPWIVGFNHTGYAVLAAHAVHLMLLGDFGYFYIKTLMTSGLGSPLKLPGSFTV
jgi:hypothetical protein